MPIKNKTAFEMMWGKDKFPISRPDTILKEVLDKMDAFSLGIACIVDDDQNLIGIITDGDIRRKILSSQKPLPALFVDDVIDHAILNPYTVQKDTSISQVIKIMDEKKIWDLPVLDKSKFIGLIHLHTILESIIDS